MRNIDTSKELQICRYRNGVKLIRPKENSSSHLSIANLLKLPFPFYLNADKFIIDCNESCAEVNGFISREDSIGKKWYRPYKLDSISETLKNENDVINNNKYKIIEDILIRKDEVNIHALSFKMPWYDEQDKIIGLFGCSVFLGKQPLAESLSQIAELGFLNIINNTFDPSNLPNNNIHPQLSKREQECLKLFLNGKTAKETSVILGLSYRTIEEYFTNIKKKLGCRYKRDLFDILN